MAIKNRIVGLKHLDPKKLRPHPGNWRKHSDTQRTALQAVLDKVGWVDALLVRHKGGGHYEILDGHLRHEMSDEKVPALVIDVDDEEANLVLTSHDPIAAMATTDKDMLSALIDELAGNDNTVDTLLEQIARDCKIDVGDFESLLSDEAEDGDSEDENGDTEGSEGETKNVPGPVRWYGGKGNHAGRIVPLLESIRHRTYVEPFGGGASIMARKRPKPVEVYNDLHGDLVNLFRVLQDKDRVEQLETRLTSTLYSREEFVTALQTLKKEDSSPLDKAWSFFVAQNQGFGGKAGTPGNWGRAVSESSRGMASIVSTFRTRVSLLGYWHERFSRVQIDNRDAIDVIRNYDSKQTLFYLDPPYAAGTRKSDTDYKHECDDSYHEKLVAEMLAVDGRCVLSGYKTPLYQPLIDAGWKAYEFQTTISSSNGKAGKKATRTEVLYISPKTSHNPPDTSEAEEDHGT